MISFFGAAVPPVGKGAVLTRARATARFAFSKKARLAIEEAVIAGTSEATTARAAEVIGGCADDTRNGSMHNLNRMGCEALTAHSTSTSAALL